MLGHFKARRLAVMLALASVTNAAGYLAAQGPVGGSAGGQSPTRIANCDVTIGSCGTPGGVLVGGGPVGGGGPSMDGCGTGSRVMCRRDSTWTCTKWVPVNVSGGAGAGGATGNTTMVCSQSITSVSVLFWP